LSVLKEFYHYCVPQNIGEHKDYLFYKRHDLDGMIKKLETYRSYFASIEDKVRLAKTNEILIELLYKKLCLK